MQSLTGEQVVEHLKQNPDQEAICTEGLYDGGIISYFAPDDSFWLEFIRDDGHPVELDYNFMSCKWKLSSSEN